MVNGMDPACISSCYGPELQTNVISIEKIYGIRLAKQKTEHYSYEEAAEKIMKSGTVNKTFFDELATIRGVLSGYCKDRDAKKAVKTLSNMNAKSTVSYIMDWLISIFERPISKRYSYSTLERYMSDIQKVFVYCEMNNIGLVDLDEDDVLEIICPFEMGKNKKEPMINANTYKNLKIVIGKLIAAMKDKNMEVPDINWRKLDRYVDKSPRLLYIPEDEDVKNRIKKLVENNQIPEAVVGTMAHELGMRKKEIYTAQTTGLRLSDGQHDYIEVVGKGSKLRRIPLRIMIHLSREILIKQWEDAVSCGRATILLFVHESTIDTVFNNCWRDVAPDGLHSFRHAFATSHLKAGVPPLRVACWMGHESLRVLQNTYDQGVWARVKDHMGKDYDMPADIAQNRLANFLSLTPERLFMLKAKLVKGKDSDVWREKLIDSAMTQFERKYKNITKGNRNRTLTMVSHSVPFKKKEDIIADNMKQETTDTVAEKVDSKKDTPRVKRKKALKSIDIKNAMEKYLKQKKSVWNWRTRSRNKSILLKWAELGKKEYELPLDGIPAYAKCKDVIKQISEKETVQREYTQVLSSFIRWIGENKYTHLVFEKRKSKK